MAEPNALVLHCWVSRRQEIERVHGWMSKEHIETRDECWQDGICLLQDGHEGEHEFTDTKDLTVRFTGDEAARAATGGGE